MGELTKNARRVAALLIAALALGSLTACSPNAGSAAVADLEKTLAEFDEIETIDAVAANNLPFLGTAEATVVLEPDTSSDRVHEIFDVLGEYLNTHPDSQAMRWRFIDLQVDTFRFAVEDTRKKNNKQFELYETASTDNAIAGGFFGPDQLTFVGETQGFVNDENVNSFHHPSLALLAKSPDDLLDVFETAQELSEKFTRYSGAWLLARTMDATFEVASADADGDGGDPTDAIAVYETIGDKFEIIGANLTPGTARIQLSTIAEAAEAKALLTTMDLDDNFTVEINGGAVAGSGTADAQAVADASDGLSGLILAQVEGDSVNFSVDSIDVASDIRDRISTLSEFDDIDHVTIATGEGPVPKLFLWSKPDDLDAKVDITKAFATASGAKSIEFTADTTGAVGLDIFIDTDDADTVAEMLEAIKPLLLMDTMLTVHAPDAKGVFMWARFTVEDGELNATGDGQNDDEARSFADLVEDAWNDA